jgi:hypothetical protein
MAKPKTNRRDRAPFIRTQPMDVPAAEVVKRAAAAGIQMAPFHVHQVRSVMRKEAREGNGNSKPAGEGWRKLVTPAVTAIAPKVKPDTDAEAKLYALAVRVGYNRARAVVDSLLEHVERVVNG